MRYSKMFGRTRMEAPADADSANAKFLIQGGFIEREAAGIYNYLPLGMRVLTKICDIVREEMNAVDGQEIFMPVLAPRENWKQTGRDETMDPILYRTKGAGDHDFVLGPSHEEIVTPLVKKFVRSYKDLPLSVYQIQAKFRNEPRAKAGILRGREFGMKDMYSFHRDNADLDAYYERAKEAYTKVYKRLGLTAYVVEASGGAFADSHSHEFSVVTPVGEDTILVCEKCNFAQNIEIVKEGEREKCPKCKGAVVEKKAIEAGNIFKLGLKYSEAFNLTYTDENGKEVLAPMGCYGIGTTRMVGTIVEASHDEKGIIWPASVAPYQLHLVSITAGDSAMVQKADELYDMLRKKGAQVLYDDRDESTGKKLNDADLIGIPVRVIISKKSLEKGGVEVKKRNEKEAKIMKPEEVLAML
ncbi:MAG: aminoacyl--tRNA ligase-related protein [Patescibacteria group bacterium]